MAHVTLEERSTEHSKLQHGRDGEAILDIVGLRVEWIMTILTLHVISRNVQGTGVVLQNPFEDRDSKPSTVHPAAAYFTSVLPPKGSRYLLLLRPLIIAI